jgi:hypothetical protein
MATILTMAEPLRSPPHRSGRALGGLVSPANPKPNPNPNPNPNQLVASKVDSPAKYFDLLDSDDEFAGTVSRYTY